MRPGGREEVLEGISEDFPYLAVLSEHDRYHQRSVPWHWHQELEFFYVLSGVVDYATPHELLTLGPGSAGLVNANVLHSTRAVDGRPGVDLLIHMPRPQFIAERCGLGSPSHFGQAFRASMGCTPNEYRHRWQDSDTQGQHTV